MDGLKPGLRSTDPALVSEAPTGLIKKNSTHTRRPSRKHKHGGQPVRESKRGAKESGAGDEVRGSDADDGLLLFAAVTPRQRMPTAPSWTWAEEEFVQNRTRARRNS